LSDIERRIFASLQISYGVQRSVLVGAWPSVGPVGIIWLDLPVICFLIKFQNFVRGGDRALGDSDPAATARASLLSNFVNQV
jgi:hypothetical protein